MVVPPACEAQVAVIRITCDNKFALFVNGAKVGEVQDEDDAWSRLFEYRVTQRLRPGLNVIAAQGRNVTGPAGLLVEGEITLPSKQVISIASGADWKITSREQPGWRKPEFDDSAGLRRCSRGRLQCRHGERRSSGGTRRSPWCRAHSGR